MNSRIALIATGCFMSYNAIKVGVVLAVAGSSQMGRRKVRTPQGRVLHNVESRKREGKCNREQTAPHSFFELSRF